MRWIQNIGRRGAGVAAPQCAGLTHLFFSPELDGRKEEGRSERERKAKALCFACVYRMPCLEQALVWHEDLGVWGGMGEGERRRFVAHLKTEGYGEEVPSGAELSAALRSFYRKDNPTMEQTLFPRRRRRVS